ncbi:MAG: hypothetical protein OEU54_11360 [Gemmatimonadota bacterium]|nr:hypothetical protein [Gemmatimonadota bacterium]
MKRAMFAAVLAGFGLIGSIHAVSAQEGWFFDATGGIALPIGNVSDYLKAGPTFGVGVGQQFENIGVGLGFDVDLLSGKDFEGATGPGANFYRYQIFGEYSFIDPRTSKNQINLIIGVGGTSISTDEVDGERLKDTYITFESGLHFGTGKVFLETVWVGMFGTQGTSSVFPQDISSMHNLTAKAGVRIG